MFDEIFDASFARMLHQLHPNPSRLFTRRRRFVKPAVVWFLRVPGLVWV